MEPIGVWHLPIQRVLSKTHKILNFSYSKYLFIAKWTFQLHAPFKEILNCIIVARISSAALNHCKKETEMAYVWDPSHIGRLRWLSSNFIDKMCPEWKFSRHGTNLYNLSKLIHLLEYLRIYPVFSVSCSCTKKKKKNWLQEDKFLYNFSLN